MTQNQDTVKSTSNFPKLKTILKGAGITSIIGLISFLSTIFLTQRSFSEWQASYYYKKNNEQDVQITKNSGNIYNIRDGFSTFKEQLNRIESKQDKIIFRMTNGGK